MSPHYVAHCEGCGENKTLTRARVETGRIVMCNCDRAMTVINIGARPKRPAPKADTEPRLKFGAQ